MRVRVRTRARIPNKLHFTGAGNGGADAGDAGRPRPAAAHRCSGAVRFYYIFLAPFGPHRAVYVNEIVWIWADAPDETAINPPVKDSCTVQPFTVECHERSVNSLG